MFIQCPTRGSMYQVDCDYLNEDEAFIVNHLLSNWPLANNPFVARAGTGAKVGSRIELAAGDFLCFLGEIAALILDDEAAVFDLDLSSLSHENLIRAHFNEIALAVTTPVEADNPGFFLYAMNWFAQRRPSIRVYVMQGLFWVERT